MFEISFPINHSDIDQVLEKLGDMGLNSTYYEPPFQVTVDDNGYGFYEKENEIIILKVYPEYDNKNECLDIIEKMRIILDIKDEIKLAEIADENWQQPFEPVDLKNEWVIADPSFETVSMKKINFEPQGSFGTGLHETTQDMLRYILDFDFSGKRVLDLGAGSGILGIAAALKNADQVTALDIRDVTEEVMHNASLNNLSNLHVLIKDVTSEKLEVSDPYDVVFINIGGDETIASMNLINSVIAEGGILLVSGLVEWSRDKIYETLKSQGYKLVKSTKTNEWVTLFLERSL